MSTIGSGGSASEFDKLIALAQFVQTDQYLPRVQQLGELEAAAKEAAQQSTAAAAEALAHRQALAKEQAKLDGDRAAFHAEQNEHRADIAKREAELRKEVEDMARDMRAFNAARQQHERAHAAWMTDKTRMETVLASREAAIANKEREFAQQDTALKRRIARIKAATDE